MSSFHTHPKVSPYIKLIENERGHSLALFMGPGKNPALSGNTFYRYPSDALRRAHKLRLQIRELFGGHVSIKDTKGDIITPAKGFTDCYFIQPNQSGEVSIEMH